MLATVGVEEDQITATDPVLPSEKVPVAVKVLVSPLARVALAGPTAKAVRVAAVTVTWVWVDWEPRAALRVLVPASTPVTRPALFPVATLGVPLVQVTLAVRSLLVPSE